MARGGVINNPDVQSDIDMKNTWKFTNYPAGSTAILSIDKTIYVDATNGTSAGVRGTSAAFQTLAQALAVAQAGDSIVFRPNSSHSVAPQTISVNNLTIFAYGAKIKVPSTTSSAIIAVTGVDEFSWLGGEFDGQRGGSAIANGGAFIIQSGATNTSIEGVYAHGFSTSNSVVRIAQSNTTSIARNRFNDNFSCISADTSGTTASAWYNLDISDNIFTGGYSTSNGSGAVKLHANCGSYISNYLISRNSITSAGQIGIENQGFNNTGGADKGRIVGNYIYGATFGISLDDVSESIVDSNQMVACAIGAEAASAVTYCTWSNNIFDAKDVTSTPVAGDQFSASNTPPPNHLLITGNQFIDGSACIHFQTAITDSVIENNKFRGATTILNLASSVRNTIRNNDFLNTGSTGEVIFFDATDAACTDNIVSGNRFNSSNPSGTITNGAIKLYSTGAHNVTNTSIIGNWTDGTTYSTEYLNGVGGTPTYRVIDNYTSTSDQSDKTKSFGLDRYIGGLQSSGGVRRLPAYRTDIVSQIFQGNGDGITLAGGTYNVGIKSVNSIGITSNSDTLVAVLDTSNGIWDVAGGFKINGTSVELPSNKGAANGYAPLDGSSKVPAANLPTLSAGTIATTTAVLKGDNAGNAIAVTQTGTGDNVLANTPTLITPVLGVATATSINGLVITSSTGTITVPNGVTATAPEITTLLGFRHIPQNPKSTAYTTVLNDSGKEIYHPVGDNNARTFTIDSNANVAYIIGTVIIFTNMAVANLSVAITSDTMTLLGSGLTGTRTIAQYGSMAVRKDTSTSWIAIPTAGVT